MDELLVPEGGPLYKMRDARPILAAVVGFHAGCNRPVQLESQHELVHVHAPVLALETEGDVLIPVTILAGGIFQATVIG